MEFVDTLKEEGQQYLDSVRRLYEISFPESEKKPFEMMTALAREGKMRILAMAEEEFIGLTICMEAGERALLDYFAIQPGFQGCGYGGTAVRKLLEWYKDKKFIFEIEIQDETAQNSLERKRRKAFYLKNGLKETGIFVNLYQVDFELITPDGSVTFEDYVGLLKDVLGEEMVRRLNPYEIFPT